MIRSIRLGNCAIVSDGSFFPSTKQSAAAFSIGNEATHRRIVGRCHVIGPPDSHSAYRAELAGIHCGLCFLYAICNSHNVKRGRIILGCDNKGALVRITKGNIKPQDQHFDYLSAITNIISELPLRIDCIHVEGHKDRVLSSDQLSLLECMNIQADTHAKIKAQTEPTATHEYGSIFKEWSPVYYQDELGNKLRLHSTLDKSLYQLLTRRSSRLYWHNKMTIPPEVRSQVNWPSLSKAFRSINPTQRKEVIKWNTGFLGTNAALFRRKQAHSAECPGCSCPNETTTHILQCSASGATEHWEEAIKTLKVWLERNNAAPELIVAIADGLTAWRINRPLPSRSYSLPHLTEAVQTQNRIGWRAFLHGFTAQEWELAQKNYLQFKKSSITSRRWISALIKKLWETIWSIWRYRNSLVHDQTNHPIKKITMLLNITMLKELQYGLAGLPRNFSYLFQKQMRSVLATSINQKKQWILTVWAARDAMTPTHVSIAQRHPIIESILVSWKRRIRQYENSQSSNRNNTR